VAGLDLIHYNFDRIVNINMDLEEFLSPENIEKVGKKWKAGVTGSMREWFKSEKNVVGFVSFH
jgi:hypothetical protein